MTLPPAPTDDTTPKKTQPPPLVLSAPEWLSLYDDIRAFVRRRIGVFADADDVTQGCFLKLYEALPTVRSASHVRAWAYRSARNAVIDYYRKRSPACRQIFDVDALEIPAVSPDIAVAAKLASCVTPLMQRLSEADREALQRVELDGHSQVDVARELDLSVSGMKSRVQRARRRLRDALQECCDLERDHRGAITSVAPRAAGCGGKACSCFA